MKRGEGAAAVVLAVSLLLSSCASPPSGTVIQEAIGRHFEARGYRVISLELGAVEPLSLAEKTYMGTETYIVELRSLQLEALVETGPPWNHRKGQVISTPRASVAIRRLSVKGGGWTVGAISGVPVR